MHDVEPLEYWGMNKGRFGQPGADGAAFCVWGNWLRLSEEWGSLEFAHNSDKELLECWAVSAQRQIWNIYFSIIPYNPDSYVIGKNMA